MIHIVLRISQPRNVVPGMLCTGRGYFPRGSNLMYIFPAGVLSYMVPNTP